MKPTRSGGVEVGGYGERGRRRQRRKRVVGFRVGDMGKGDAGGGS